MGFSLDVSVPMLTVFLQGLLSFFSPCVLPLLPLYIGYLSGGTRQIDEDGRITYKRSKVFTNTLFFVVGVSFAFFMLGLGFSALGNFFKSNQLLFARIGAVIIIVFGLYQFGIFGQSKVLGKEKRFQLPLARMGMSPITALVLGFTFSFAWTPCVGPALTSVLLMTATAGTKTMGLLLIGVYTLGFVLPFLAAGFFTTSLLSVFKKHQSIVQYTVKVGAVLMIVMGILMFTGKMNAVTGYLSEISVPKKTEDSKEENQAEKDSTEKDDVEEDDIKGQDKNAGNAAEEGSNKEEAAKGDSAQKQEPKVLPAIDFTLKDQFGETHTLSDYKGKTVFLNFWATWCPPCKAEMPDIQKIYEEYKEAADDSVVILGIAAPDYGGESSESEITAFLEENGYTYPVVMDHGGKMFMEYGVFSYPTTYMIDKNGNVFGYASGQLNEDLMRDIIRQTVEGKRSEK